MKPGTSVTVPLPYLLDLQISTTSRTRPRPKCKMSPNTNTHTCPAKPNNINDTVKHEELKADDREDIEPISDDALWGWVRETALEIEPVRTRDGVGPYRYRPELGHNAVIIHIPLTGCNAGMTAKGIEGIFRGHPRCRDAETRLLVSLFNTNPTTYLAQYFQSCWDSSRFLFHFL